MSTKRIGGGGLRRIDVERTIRAMEKLRGRPFQIRDFVKLAGGVKVGQPGYHKHEVRFYTIVRSGAIGVLKVGDAEMERTKYRYYKVVNPGLWQPRVLKEKGKRRPNLAKLITQSQTRDRGTYFRQAVSAAVTEALQTIVNRLDAEQRIQFAAAVRQSVAPHTPAPV